MPLIRAALDRREIAAFLAVLLCAFAVAAAIERHPADFSAPAVALLRDRQQHPLWAIRIAAQARLIAVDAIAAPPPPAGHAYQLWLAGSDRTRSLGLLPVTGRRVIPETPAVIAALGAGEGELIVTLEPARGSATAQPSGPVMFRAPPTAASAASPRGPVAPRLLACHARTK